jgi:hypothetical protein
MCLQFDGRRPEPLAAGEVIVELRNGDRLRGAIAGYVPATPRASQPAQLLVRPSPELRSPKETVAIEMDWVRRVVFDVSPHRRPCAPGAVLGRDGRSHTYQALRWSADALTLLTEEGVERIPLTELAEVRMANADPWDWYCRELWDLDPQGKSPLFRMETADGSSLTTSLRRATQNRNDAGPVATQRTLQPVWAAGPISVPWSFTCRLWQAPPHVVPLSRIAPERVDQRTVLGGPWSWQAERNVLGGPLHSGGLDALWGLGVHARNALAFPLPDSARLFRANVGIDAAADGAGCVVAKVYVTQPASQLLFESKPLVGGGPTAYTGQLALGGGAGRHLVLVAESAGPLRPEGGEPLDIGDHLDWLEPTLVLDPAALWEEVAKRRAAGR